MKKNLISVFWILMYIIFLDLFAYDIIVQGRWEPFSLATVYMSVAAFSLLRLGFHINEN